MAHTPKHILIRATADDLTALTIITDALRASGHSFAVPTDAVRHPLATTAAVMSAQRAGEAA
jgi:hypothetical protein